MFIINWQEIFCFINSISILVILTYCYDFCVTCVCPVVYIFYLFIYFFLRLMILSTYSHCSYISSIWYMSSSLSFSFLSTLLVIGGEFSQWIRAAWSTPTHWLLWVSRSVSILFLLSCFFFSFFFFFFFCKLFFGGHRWGVDALFHIHHVTSFNYDAKEARDVGLSCRCHLSNSQIVSSVLNTLERITCLWLYVSLCICCRYCYVFYFCSSVCLFICLCFLLLFLFCFFVFFGIFHWILM